jgi:hypothetical protein
MHRLHPQTVLLCGEKNFVIMVKKIGKLHVNHCSVVVVMCSNIQYVRFTKFAKVLCFTGLYVVSGPVEFFHVQ